MEYSIVRLIGFELHHSDNRVRLRITAFVTATGKGRPPRAYIRLNEALLLAKDCPPTTTTTPLPQRIERLPTKLKETITIKFEARVHF